MLKEQIREFQENFLAQAPTEVVDIILKSTQKMIDKNLKKNAILPKGKLVDIKCEKEQS